jgi:hypothetical protein
MAMTRSAPSKNALLTANCPTGPNADLLNTLTSRTSFGASPVANKDMSADAASQFIGSANAKPLLTKDEVIASSIDVPTLSAPYVALYASALCVSHTEDIC